MKKIKNKNEKIMLTPEIFLGEFLVKQGITLDQIITPPLAALAFQPDCLNHLIYLSQAKSLGEWSFPISEDHLYLGKFNEQSVLIGIVPSCAPNAVAFVECLISLGVNRIIATGAAGSIHPSAKPGNLIIPTGAIREEGTSLHYYDLDKKVHPSKSLVNQLKESLLQNHLPILSGPTWTTDGVFRETIDKMVKYRSQGVLTIEMEMSALFAFGMFRRIAIAGLLIISDTHYESHENIVFDQVYRTAEENAARVVLDALCSGNT